MKNSIDIKTKELTPSLWSDLERLFGENGACGGCWCMSWRREKDDDWKKIQGAETKKRFKKLVTSGKAHGILAYHDDEPIGWCSFDRRTDYVRLDRLPSLKCDDADLVWSVTCFFIKKDYRKQGVGSALLEHALKALKKHGAKIVEGYPVNPYSYGKNIPAAFAWTGTQSLFKKAGFKVVGNKGDSKERVRLYLQVNRLLISL
ncbi:MAG: GNAT family N-acetyltransferase [Proteobacteria bacterium]|nr:GNAT family N-acetyltransferase [Pseudomonadota bacterium]